MERLEITTKIGCPVNCKKYCPQHKTIKNYAGDQRLLDLETFKKALSSVPKTVRIDFSGYCEPFANSEAIDLIEYAFQQGFKIHLFTTLFQASVNDVKRLSKIKFEGFTLHLPDGVYMNIPISHEYMENVFYVLRNVPNVKVMLMNDTFQTDNREVLNESDFKKKKFMRQCILYRKPDFVLLPNGDLQLCCRDFALRCRIGNLLTEDYLVVRERFLGQKKDFALCYDCILYESLKKRSVKRVTQLIWQGVRKRRELEIVVDIKP